MKKNNVFIVLLIVLSISCREDENFSQKQIVKESINGLVQKGPFINGTSITISELDESLVQTGNIFTTQIIDNSGIFELKDITLNSPFIQLKADGYYFDEVLGEKSSAQLTLFALSDISGKGQINVNILTHLEKGRVQFLIDQGVEFNSAKDSAQHELLSAFGIDNQNIDNSEDLDISINDSGNATLIALSIILQANNSVANLTELLANINTDFRQDGILNSESIKSKLFNETQNLNLEQIRTNLENRYADLGLNTDIPNFESIIKNYLNNQKPFTVQAEVSNVTCKSTSDGSIDITVNEGIEPFTYLWSNGVTSEDLDNVDASTYSVTITDANGYIQNVKDIIVSEPEELSISFSLNHVTNFGGYDGSIILSVSGGTEPYSYQWSNGQISNNIQDLKEGVYEIVVTDSNFCSKKSETTVYTIFLDDRDNEEYKTIEIANQVWFAENIRSLHNKEGYPITRNCMNNDEDCLNGGLYTHETANEICPNGWHLTTDDDWKALESYLGMTATEINSISYRGDIASQLLEGGTSNLNIKHSGYRLDDEGTTIYYMTNDTYFWTANREYIRGFSSREDGVYRAGIGPSNTIFWLNCRCVKDN